MLSIVRAVVCCCVGDKNLQKTSLKQARVTASQAGKTMSHFPLAANENHYHRVIASKRPQYPLTVNTFADSGSPDYSYTRVALGGIPAELALVALAKPERFWFNYAVFDSDGHTTSGKIYYQAGQNPTLPEFPFMAHRGVFYTIVVTISLPDGIKASRSIMLAPNLEDEGYIASPQDVDEEEEYVDVEAAYEGDSVPSVPRATKEQLDRDLDSIAFTAQLCRAVSPGECKCVVGGTLVTSVTIDNGKGKEEEDCIALDDDGEDGGATVDVEGGFQFNAQEYQQWWSNRWETLQDEQDKQYEADQRYQQERADYFSGRGSPNHPVSGKSSDEAVDAWESPNHSRKIDHFPLEALKEHIEDLNNTPTTAKARAECYMELQGQW